MLLQGLSHGQNSLVVAKPGLPLRLGADVLCRISAVLLQLLSEGCDPTNEVMLGCDAEKLARVLVSDDVERIERRQQCGCDDVDLALSDETLQVSWCMLNELVDGLTGREHLSWVRSIGEDIEIGERVLHIGGCSDCRVDSHKRSL